MEETLVSVALDGQSIDRARFQAPFLADLRQMLPHLQRSLDRAGVRGPFPDGRGAGEDAPEELPGRPSLPWVERGRCSPPPNRLAQGGPFQPWTWGWSGRSWWSSFGRRW